MNKQELIGKWENKKGAPSYEISAFPVNPSLNEMYIAGYGVAKTEILKDLNQLDEPQKPVVDSFVAEWFEDNKDALDLAIFMAIRELDDEEWPHKTDFENWLDVAENKPIETLIRMKDGYEVEKEPLYYVKIPSLAYDMFLVKGEDGELIVFQNTSYGTKFTEAEIKAIDERYWAFAVPVAEG